MAVRKSHGEISTYGLGEPWRVAPKSLAAIVKRNLMSALPITAKEILVGRSH